MINKCGRTKGSRKSLLEYHSNNCYQQDPLMNTNISRQKFKETDICKVSKYFPQNIY